jgi:hypothetical protein
MFLPLTEDLSSLCVKQDESCLSPCGGVMMVAQDRILARILGTLYTVSCRFEAFYFFV